MDRSLFSDVGGSGVVVLLHLCVGQSESSVYAEYSSVRDVCLQHGEDSVA